MLFEGSPYLHYDKDRAHKRQFKLWLAEPSETSSGGIGRSNWFWRRMEAHFNSRSDGIGLIVDGRMAQAFAKDCAPDELAVWSWTGAADEPVANLWTQTQTGLCVAALVLPHDALPPVRVETTAADDYLARLIKDSQQAIRSDFDVYLIGNRLVYVKEACARADTEAMFFLHLHPVDVNGPLRPSQAARLRQSGLQIRLAWREGRRDMSGGGRSPRVRRRRNQHRPVRASGRRLRSPLGGGDSARAVDGTPPP